MLEKEASRNLDGLEIGALDASEVREGEQGGGEAGEYRGDS